MVAEDAAVSAHDAGCCCCCCCCWMMLLLFVQLPWCCGCCCLLLVVDVDDGGSDSGAVLVLTSLRYVANCSTPTDICTSAGLSQNCILTLLVCFARPKPLPCRLDNNIAARPGPHLLLQPPQAASFQSLSISADVTTSLSCISNGVAMLRLRYCRCKSVTPAKVGMRKLRTFEKPLPEEVSALRALCGLGLPQG